MRFFAGHSEYDLAADEIKPKKPKSFNCRSTTVRFAVLSADASGKDSHVRKGSSANFERGRWSGGEFHPVSLDHDECAHRRK